MFIDLASRVRLTHRYVQDRVRGWHAHILTIVILVMALARFLASFFQCYFMMFDLINGFSLQPYMHFC